MKAQFPFFDGPPYEPAELVQIEKRACNACFVVEPVVRGEKIVPVVPIRGAVVYVRPGWRRKADGVGVAAHRRVGVGAGNSDLRNLSYGQLVRQVVQAVDANKIVLDVDAVEREVRILSTQAIDRGV